MLERIRRQPTWLLGRAQLQAHTLLQQAFVAAGSRPYHYRALAALDEHGAMSQADLGRRTGIDRSDVVATLNELAGQSLVRREPDPADGRRNIVKLTRKGRTELLRLDAVLADIQDQVLAPLTRSERATLVKLLEKLVATPPTYGRSAAR